MRHFTCVVGLAVSVLTSTAEAEPRRGYVAVGVGFPELLHAQLGIFLNERLSLDVRAGVPLLNPLAGLGVTYFATGESLRGAPPRTNFYVNVDGRFNVLDPTHFAAGGDRLGMLVGLYGGWAFQSDVGFLFRIQAGPLVYWEHGPAFGANAFLLVGWAL